MKIPKFDEIFKQINTSLTLLGIFPDKTKLGLKFIIPLFTAVLMVIEEMSFFVSRMSSENFLELTALAPCITNGILCLAKITSIAINRRDISNLMKSLDKLYHDILNDCEKRELVLREIVLVKSLTKYNFVLNAILICVYNFSTLLFMLRNYITEGTVSYSLPYSVLLPFCTDKLSTWLPVYIHSIFCGKTVF